MSHLLCSQDTRTHVVGELYDTERSYVESLQILVEVSFGLRASARTLSATRYRACNHDRDGVPRRPTFVLSSVRS